MFFNIYLKKISSVSILFAFFSHFLVLPPVFAQEFFLPKPGSMVLLSPSFSPAVLKGIKLDPNDPLRFNFLIDRGDESQLSISSKGLQQEQFKAEASKLIKYFLTSLTIPETDLWVNLSPYEKDRIIPKEFGQTVMGRDLLAQDYLLKQITASLIYPESDLGKKFWDKIYKQAQAKYGTTNIPINTFNKVWIVPEKAVVYENNGIAFILENHLKVMLEEDYLSTQKNHSQPGDMFQKEQQNVSPSPLPSNAALTMKAPQGNPPSPTQMPTRGRPLEVPGKRVHVQNRTTKNVSSSTLPSELPTNVKAPQVNPQKPNDITSQIIKEIIIPTLEKEVNEGQNFAQLRQVFYSLILATWYKNKIKDSILNKVYSNQNKIIGLNIDKEDKDKIYQEYLKAFKKGVFNYIKEEPVNNNFMPRKYFSGGVNAAQLTINMAMIGPKEINHEQRAVLEKTKIINLTTDIVLNKVVTGTNFQNFLADLYRNHPTVDDQNGTCLTCAFTAVKLALEAKIPAKIFVHKNKTHFYTIVYSPKGKPYVVDLQPIDPQLTKEKLIIAPLEDLKGKYEGQEVGLDKILQQLLTTKRISVMQIYEMQKLNQKAWLTLNSISHGDIRQTEKVVTGTNLHGSDSVYKNKTGVSGFMFESKELVHSTNLESIFRKILFYQEQKIRNQKINIITKFPQEGIFIHTPSEEDRYSLENDVLNELIFNALKYTPAGGTITISAQQENDEVVFSVADTGIGISQEDMIKVWEQGFRAENAQKINKGTGFGLSIMRLVVEKILGGTIQLESKIGQGSTFTVRLPIEKNEAMTSQRLGNNLAINHISRRSFSDQMLVGQVIKEFLLVDHPLKKKIFNKINAWSDENIEQEMKNILDIPISRDQTASLENKKSLHLYDPWSLRELFLHPTRGAEDIPQAFTDLSLVQNRENIDQRLKSRGYFTIEKIEQIIQQSYLLLKAIEILSRSNNLFLKKDVSLHSALFKYYISKHVIVEDTSRQRKVQRSNASNFYSLSNMLISQVMGYDILTRKNAITTPMLVKAMARPKNKEIRDSIQNFIKFFDFLKTHSKEWALEMNRPLSEEEEQTRLYKNHIKLLRESLKFSNKAQIAADRVYYAHALQLLKDHVELNVNEVENLAKYIDLESSFVQHHEGFVMLKSRADEHKILEISPLGSIRFFDEHGRWVMRVDPFGNKTEEIKWNSKAEVEEVLIRGINNKMVKFINTKEAWEKNYTKSIGFYQDFPHQGNIFKFDKPLSKLFNPKDHYLEIPRVSHASEASGFWSALLGTMSLLALDQDVNNRLIFRERVQYDALYYNLLEVSDPSEPISLEYFLKNNASLEWIPSYNERIFNAQIDLKRGNKHDINIFYKGKEIQRVYIDGKIFINYGQGQNPTNNRNSIIKQEDGNYKVYLGIHEQMSIDGQGLILSDHAMNSNERWAVDEIVKAIRDKDLFVRDELDLDLPVAEKWFKHVNESTLILAEYLLTNEILRRHLNRILIIDHGDRVRSILVGAYLKEDPELKGISLKVGEIWISGTNDFVFVANSILLAESNRIVEHHINIEDIVNELFVGGGHYVVSSNTKINKKDIFAFLKSWNDQFKENLIILQLDNILFLTDIMNALLKVGINQKSMFLNKSRNQIEINFSEQSLEQPIIFRDFFHALENILALGLQATAIEIAKEKKLLDGNIIFSQDERVRWDIKSFIHIQGELERQVISGLSPSQDSILARKYYFKDQGVTQRIFEADLKGKKINETRWTRGEDYYLIVLNSGEAIIFGDYENKNDAMVAEVQRSERITDSPKTIKLRLSSAEIINKLHGISFKDRHGDLYHTFARASKFESMAFSMGFIRDSDKELFDNVTGFTYKNGTVQLRSILLPDDLQNKNIGGEIYKIRSSIFPDGVVFQGGINNFQTRKRLYEHCFIDPDGFVRYRKDLKIDSVGLRIVDGQAKDANEISIHNVLASTLLGKIMYSSGLTAITAIVNDFQNNITLVGVSALRFAIKNSYMYEYKDTKQKNMVVGGFEMRGIKRAGKRVQLVELPEDGTRKTTFEKGGIDFNPAQMKIEVRAGKSVPSLESSFEERLGNNPYFDSNPVTGVEFIIRDMVAVVDLPSILGLK